MSVSVAEALDYSPKEISAGSYILRLVSPEGQQPTLALASTINTDFLLPNTVFNLSKSYLNFNYVLAAGAANHFIGAHSGFLAPIDGIVLSTAAGQRLVDLNNVDIYTKLAWRPETNLEEYMTHPCHSVSVQTVADVAEAGQLFNRTRVLADPLAAATSVQGGQYVSAEDGKAYLPAQDAYNCVSNFVGNANHTQAQAMRCQIPLKMLYGSLLAVDKDLFFNEQLRLTIRWAPGANWGFDLNSAGGMEAPANAGISVLAAPVVSNVALRIAVETNDAIVSGIKQRVLADAGIQIRTPFVHVHKGMGSAVASDTTTIIRKMNRGHGSKLLRVFIGIFSASDDGNRHANNYNFSAAAPPAFPKWVSYRTFLDSKPITDDTLTMADFGAYEYHREKLIGSVLKGYKDWACCPTIIEDFSGVKYSKNYPETDHVSSGLDLTNEREFSFQFTNGAGIAAALPVYIFAVCQRTLSITKNGIAIM